MIRMSYHGEPYYYEHTGKQEYDVRTDITMDNDAEAYSHFEALVRLMKLATYNLKAGTVRRIVERLIDEGVLEDDSITEID